MGSCCAPKEKDTGVRRGLWEKRGVHGPEGGERKRHNKMRPRPRTGKKNRKRLKTSREAVSKRAQEKKKKATWGEVGRGLWGLGEAREGKFKKDRRLLEAGRKRIGNRKGVAEGKKRKNKL